MLETSVPTPTSLLTVIPKWLHIFNNLLKCFGVTVIRSVFSLLCTNEEKTRDKLTEVNRACNRSRWQTNCSWTLSIRAHRNARCAYELCILNLARLLQIKYWFFFSSLQSNQRANSERVEREARSALISASSLLIGMSGEKQVLISCWIDAHNH